MTFYDDPYPFHDDREHKLNLIPCIDPESLIAAIEPLKDGPDVYQVPLSFNFAPQATRPLNEAPSLTHIDRYAQEQETLLDWFEQQTIYPKFYWRSRDDSETVIALGQQQRFTHIDSIYANIGPTQRVWGGRSFDGGSEKNPACPENMFFLPHLEVVKTAQQWVLNINLSGDRSRLYACLRALRTSPNAPQQTDKIRINSLLSTKTSALTHSPTAWQWRNLVEKVLEHIDDHQVKKVVLARQTRLCLTSPLSIAQLMKASGQQNHDCFHFVMAVKPDHSFLGSSPERLYLRQGSRLQTEALAGTAGRGATLEQDQALTHWLQNDPKNLLENQYVVDDILQNSAGVAEPIYIADRPRVIKLSAVQHLKRDIELCINSPERRAPLLYRLQPTAAVAGLPRDKALEFIRQHEPIVRGWYAGSVGYIGHDKAELCVAIRSALVQQDCIDFYAGAGIVAGSDSTLEWQELDRKVNTLLSLIISDNDLHTKKQTNRPQSEKNPNGINGFL